MRPFIAASFLVAACTHPVSAASQVQAPEWKQLPPPAKSLAVQLGMNAGNFDRTLSEINQQTATRLQEGEFDHLIYYMLQSRSFTSAAPIEPALSSVEYVQGRPSVIPEFVQTRMTAFAHALATPTNQRQRYFASLLPSHDPLAEIRSQYARAMTSLYRKEAACGDAMNPQACIAATYLQRGLSSDTSPESMAAIEAGVRWLSANRPALKFRRVLIVGPGVDFAPRTALTEDSLPRAYQPGSVARLVGLPKVGCADINLRVLAFVQDSCDTAYQMNIATGFLTGSGKWDLIIATNVLLYLGDRELLLALNNIRMMLNPDAVFLHNDARFTAKLFGAACGLPAIHFGEVHPNARNPRLTDRFVLHAQD